MAGTLAVGTTNFSQQVAAQSSKPNILFFILDDVGISQLAGKFGNGGLIPPRTPNINMIERNGVTFTNVWAMPECSPSRATFFTGRYPVRTGVDAVIVRGHLPQTYMSQYEATVPRVLAKAGYTSALIGKWHLGNDQDTAGDCAPVTRGFDVFQGSMRPGPTSIDLTAGGVDKSGSQLCGYFQTKANGACYTAPGDSVRCRQITQANTDPGTDPSRTCLQDGGIFVKNKACGVNAPRNSDFSRTNAYYVWPRTNLTGPLDPLFVAKDNQCGSTIDRTYMTIAQGNDGVKWWKQQSGARMLTMSFNTIHTPTQKPPTSMVPDPLDLTMTCNNVLLRPDLINMMIESADVEIGRVLARLGLATLRADGRTMKSLDLGNTVIVIVGDNGSQGLATRPPTLAARAKGTVYQLGIWVPLVVAGPMVKVPNRKVDAMINAADLYQLFGEVAGLDVKSTVPPSHALDSEPMLAYLTKPAQPPIRTTNYSQLGVGTFGPREEDRDWPCLMGNTCNDTLVDSQALCENDNGGVWYGPGGKKQLNSCCAVQQYLGTPLTLAPVKQSTIRGGVFNGTLGAFKLVETQTIDCSKPITNASQKAFPWADHQTGAPVQEFYDLTLNPKQLDNSGNELSKNCAPGQDLTTCLPTQLDVRNYTRMNNQLQKLNNAASAQNKCRSKGDGNLDMRVTQADLDNWSAFNGKGPSVYDINVDGQTDEKDRNIIKANIGLDCMNICQRADLNRDGKVDSTDLNLLNKQRGTCSDQIFCGGDLNGDGKVISSDIKRMKNAQQSCQ
jgi:hypothetical protein